MDHLVKNKLKEINQSSLAKALLNVVLPIRKQISEVTNSFQGNLLVNRQQEFIPFSLVSLYSLLIDGADPTPTNVSQAALSVSQLIMFSYKKQSKIIQTSEISLANRRHLEKRETPLQLYVGLKLMAIKAKTIIQKLFLLGICISYDRCLDICNNIVVSMLEKFDNDDVLPEIPGKIFSLSLQRTTLM